MKQKKLFLALIACLFAAGSIINMHLAQSDHNTDISLADISVMAQARGESGNDYVRPLATIDGKYCCLNTQYSACSASIHCDDV